MDIYKVLFILSLIIIVLYILYNISGFSYVDVSSMGNVTFNALCIDGCA